MVGYAGQLGNAGGLKQLCMLEKRDGKARRAGKAMSAGKARKGKSATC